MSIDCHSGGDQLVYDSLLSYFVSGDEEMILILTGYQKKSEIIDLCPVDEYFYV